MRNISYFYMRERVLIKAMADFVFVGSTIDELMFERVRVVATDLSLVGVFAARVHIVDSMWSTRRSTTIRRVPPQRIDEFVATNTTFNRIVPALYGNNDRVIFKQCRIDTLQPAPSLPPRNVTSYIFAHTSIGHWHSHSWTSARRVGSIEWRHVSIEHIHHHAIYASEIGQLQMRNVHISTISSRAFERNAIEEVTIASSTIGAFGRSSFGGTATRSISIANVDVLSIDDEALAALNTTQLTIVNSTFDRFAERLFRYANVCAACWRGNHDLITFIL